MAKAVFWIGTIGDGLLAVEWFAVSLGLVRWPIVPSFFVGESEPYRYAMGVGALFMLGWTVVLYWGSRRPLQRRGLLLITGLLLLLAIFVELLGYTVTFPGLQTYNQMFWGIVLKGYLVLQFLFAYWYCADRGSERDATAGGPRS